MWEGLGRAGGAALVLALLAGSWLGPQASGDESFVFTAPPAHGLIAPGESVAYELDACQDANVRVVVRTEDQSHAGPETSGCAGIVSVPTEADLEGSGIADHDIREVVLEAGEGVELPLRLKRTQAQHAERVAGELTVSEADDPFGGGEALDVLSSVATISLGTINLSEVSSISIRAAAERSAFCHPSIEGTYCRAGRAIVTGGGPDGPVLSAIEIMGTGPDRPWGRTVSEPLRHHPDGPVEVFVTFVEAVPGGCTPGPHDFFFVRCAGADAFARINYIEFNGSGVAQPHEFPEDPDDAIWIFDGTSLDGWEMTGTGDFFLEDDGSMRTFSGFGLLWYAERTFADYILRLEFKVDSPDANSGVFVRFPEPSSALEPNDTGYEVQIQDYGQAYIASSDIAQTGAIYSFEAAERLNTRTVGEWNTLEIRVVGHDYTVELNGRVIIDGFEGWRELDGYIGLQNHDPLSTVWFRDIRVIEL